MAECPECGRSLFTTIDDLSASELLARHRWGGGCAAADPERDGGATEEHPAGS